MATRRRARAQRFARSSLRGCARAPRRRGAQFPNMLVEEATNDWWAMLRPVSARPHRDDRRVSGAATATVVQINSEGHRRQRFDGPNTWRASTNWAKRPCRHISSGRAAARQASASYQTVPARAPNFRCRAHCRFAFSRWNSWEGARTRSRRLPCDAPCRPGHLSAPVKAADAGSAM